MSTFPKSIYKYEIQPRPSAGVQIVDLPTHAQILDCKMVDGRLFFWALIDTRDALVRRAFRVYPTGDGLPVAPGRHVGTVAEHQSTPGWPPFIWHVFEVPAC